MPRPLGKLAAGLAPGAVLALALSGCPFRFEKEQRVNAPPTTFFDVAPPDTSFKDEVFFRWIGTDLDSDVVAYQYQLVVTDSLYYFTGGQQGTVLSSWEPFNTTGEEQWSERVTEDDIRFFDLEDGWYEFRVRAIDAANAPDPDPARKRFYVFFDDVFPEPFLENDPLCGRLGGVEEYIFWINAIDRSRNAVTPRSKLQYSVQLRANSTVNCDQHLADPFTEWRFFPDDGSDPVPIGDEEPTRYNDLSSQGCRWTFKLRVRDPAGNMETFSCEISQQ